MSAASSTLLRRPPQSAAHAPRTATPDPRVTITGTLLGDGHTRIEPATGRAAFSVVIAQAAGRPDVIATCWVGDGPDAAAHADDRARGLRAGDIVTVHGDGLAMRYVHGTLAVALVFTRSVELVIAREEPRT